MTRSEIQRKEQMTAEAFHDRLSELVREAREGDVDVRGGWDVEDEGNDDMSVEIFPVISE